VNDLHYASDAIPVFRTFVETLRNGTDEFQAVCGEGSRLSEVLETGDLVTDALCDIAGLLRNVRAYFDCDNWYPLYENLSYETVCYSGTEGFAWVATTSFVIVFMTMVILTLRITFYEVDNHNVKVQDVNNNKIVEDPNVIKGAPDNSEEEEEIDCSVEQLLSPNFQLSTAPDESEEMLLGSHAGVVLATEKTFQSNAEWPKDEIKGYLSSGEFSHPAHGPPSEIIYEKPMQLSPEAPKQAIFDQTWDDIILEDE
jgi:hypothetical protein